MIETNPWSAIWTHPRSTIRGIVNLHPAYGVFRLSFVYVLYCLIFIANFYSLGLVYSFDTVLFSAVIVSPFLAWIWIYFSGWFLYGIGRLFGGGAPASHLRAALAWSKIPYSLGLFMWLTLGIDSSGYLFVWGAFGPSAFFIHLILLIISLWSLILFCGCLREVQGFSLQKSAFNVISYYLIYIFVIFIFI